ncbi:folate-binding protein [uncultured Rhodospira sp.]|uniref:CAF17-like 4Fe-4S cluster assembly/insertion protein YgfZ n=1 Tax=uncultured Rhodospira sp. TaxID=1936189 RepID=UPI00262972DB|nr:folate-binding protein [uncultured Rhodospira sp.]
MTALDATILETRALLVLSGEDRVRFLQGLVTNDVTKVSPARAVFSALLSPQGKVLFDLVLAAHGDTVLIEVEAARLEDLRARLRRFKLRAKIALAPAEGWSVAAVWGEAVPHVLGLPNEAGAAHMLDDRVVFMDPRLPRAGARLYLPADRAGSILENLGARLVDASAYDRHRLGLGLPDGARDMDIEKRTALECGLDDLGGVDFAKGCYMGQELTARTKYRGLLKRRLMPVSIAGPVPEPGTPLFTEAGKDAGEMRSGMVIDETAGLGLAVVRLEALATGAPLVCGDARLTPRVPDWMALPAPAEAG